MRREVALLWPVLAGVIALAGSVAGATTPATSPPTALIRLEYRPPLPPDSERWSARMRTAYGDHLNYLLKTQGSIRFVGQQWTLTGGTVGEMILFSSWEDTAERFAARDPVVLAGLATYRIEDLEVLDLDRLRDDRELERTQPRELLPLNPPDLTVTPPQR